MDQFKKLLHLIRSKINPDSVTEMSWVFIGQLTTVVLSFVIVKILSNMGAAQYGIYTLVITVTAFFGLLFYGPVLQGFLRFYYHYLEKSLSNIFVKLIYRVLLISGIIFFLLAVVFYLFSPLFNFSLSSFFFLITGIYVVTFKVDEFFNSVLNLVRKRKENSIIQGIEKAAIIVYLILLKHFDLLELKNVFIALVFNTILFAFIKIKFFERFLPEEPAHDKDFIKDAHKEMGTKLFRYVLPFLIWGLSGWLQLNGEKWIINGLLSTADVGIYAIMLAIVNALVIIPNNIISEFATPIIFKQYSDLNNVENVRMGFHYIRINMLMIFAISVFSTLVTYFFGKELISLVSNKSYTVYWYLLPLICFGTGMFFTGQAHTVLGMALNLPNKYLAPKILIGVVSVLLNIFLIKNLGINGVAYTVLIVGIIYLIHVAFINKRIISDFKFSLE
ncbi:MAG: lipopolysaccharide biosynthesis protein [Ignavibacteriaceae bacterium]